MQDRAGDELPFLDPGELSDGDVRLVLTMYDPADAELGVVPSYEWQIQRATDGAVMGSICLRVGPREQVLYMGHIGYGVDERYRGHRYAARATRLLIPVARALGLRELWITTAPDNVASQRTCEIMGAEHVETLAVPPGTSLFDEGEHQKRCYRLRLD
jgi:predicted acetyltransferase